VRFAAVGWLKRQDSRPALRQAGRSGATMPDLKGDVEALVAG